MTDPTPSLLLASTSRASDATWLAVADVVALTQQLDVDWRLVGGNAVALLAQHHGAGSLVPDRETADADLGIPYTACADPRLVPLLLAAGYTRSGGNRFERREDGRLVAIDVLAPSYQGRILSNQEHGDLVVDEIPGLLEALQLPPIRLAIDVALTDATLHRLAVDLPDVRAALLLKAYAFRDRLAGRDAIDVWRLLESANRAGHTAATWPHGSGWREGAALLHRHFGATGRMVALPDRAVRTRVRALTVRVVPPGPTTV